MRPIAAKQDFLRSPLNNLLNTEANVRLLRVLAEVDEPMSAKEAASRAELTEPGARLALKRLVATGFVTRSGSDRNFLFALRHEDPLTEAVVSVFATERRRYEALLVALRLAVVNSTTPPRSAWISRLPGEPGETLEIAALHRADDLPLFMLEIREKLSFIETSFDITIEIVAYTRANLPEIQPDGITELVGPPPPGAERPSEGEGAGPGGVDHESARFAQALAEMLVRSPSLVERALHHLDEVLRERPRGRGEDLREWQRVLSSYPMPRLQRFVVSNSLRALRLRRCSPFPAVLTPSERERVEKFMTAGG